MAGNASNYMSDPAHLYPTSIQQPESSNLITVDRETLTQLIDQRIQHALKAYFPGQAIKGAPTSSGRVPEDTSALQAQAHISTPVLDPFLAPAYTLVESFSSPVLQQLVSTKTPNVFLPPIATPTTDIPHTLSSLFPYVDKAILLDIINHTLRPEDLHKLDRRLLGKPDVQMMYVDGTTGQLRASLLPRSQDPFTTYGSLDDVETPLINYIAILTSYTTMKYGSNFLSLYLMEYLQQLRQLARNYEWSAVLVYHLDFFCYRCRDMKLGNYNAWAFVDPKLYGDHLISKVKCGVASLDATAHQRGGASFGGRRGRGRGVHA